MGHLAEADLTVNSAFGGKVGDVVAAEDVSMVDDGTLAGKVGVSKYDDEGVLSSRVEIIKDSVLTELLTNREYAKKIDQRPTGNARAESYLYQPIIRMIADPVNTPTRRAPRSPNRGLRKFTRKMPWRVSANAITIHINRAFRIMFRVPYHMYISPPSGASIAWIETNLPYKIVYKTGTPISVYTESSRSK